MVRLHMVDHEIVYRTVTKDRIYIGKVFFFESCFHRVNERYFLIHDKIRVVTHPERERPEALEQHLVFIIDTY